MKALLSKTERETIAARIAKVEETTAGELVVHLVERSSNYAFVRLIYAFSSAYVLTQIATLTEPLEAEGIHLSDWALPALPLLALALWLLFGLSPILRRIAPRGLVASAVHHRAERAFLENRVHRTVDASGVLILVSELEHRVEILADEGIHERVGVAGWAKHVDQIVSEIRAGCAADGLLRALDEIGLELAAGFPPRAIDTNELPDEVVRTER